MSLHDQQNADADVERNRLRTFAIISTWPDLKNAEYEVVERIRIAANNLGVVALTIDDDGYILASTEANDPRLGSRIDQSTCLFVISLHFQSPRLHDIYSYIALWNPPEFYRIFGYVSTATNTASHNDVLSCHSDVADAHALNIFAGFGRSLECPLPSLFHGLPLPYLEPAITSDAKLFYIGINWERLSGTKGRHHDLLEQLDAKDLVSIYGPELFLGVRPWGGFRNYKGEIPFDGRSVLTEIGRAGICLALSSAAHQRSGIMSNRLFEGIAAGAIIIANPHPFIEKYFADCVYTVDDGLSSAELAEAVTKIVTDIRNDPAAARARALMAQQRLAERFSLDVCLSALISNHAARVAHASGNLVKARRSVTVLVKFEADGVEQWTQMVENLCRQRHVEIVVFAMFDSETFERHAFNIEFLKRTALASACVKAWRDLPVLPNADRRLFGATQGVALEAVLAQIDHPFFCFMGAAEYWFSDHVATLAVALDSSQDSFMAASGLIIEDWTSDTRARRRLDSLTFTGDAELLNGTDGSCPGRFMYRTSLLQNFAPHVLKNLDGSEQRAISLWAAFQGSIANSNYATLVWMMDRLEASENAQLCAADQVETILDSVRGKSQWRRRWTETSSRRRQPTHDLTINRVYLFGHNGDGNDFLRFGFAAAQDTHVPIDGRHAQLRLIIPASNNQYTLALRIRSRLAGTSLCSVSANGTEILSNADLKSISSELTALLPVASGTGTVPIIVDIRLNRSEQLRDATGKVVDTRYLSADLEAVGVFDASRKPPYLRYDSVLNKIKKEWRRFVRRRLAPLFRT